MDHSPRSPGGIFTRSFFSLLSTQFMGAANDNILKQLLTFMVATGLWSGSLRDGGLGEGGQAIPALCLTLPFILLSGIAGQLADRFSKRDVMFAVKIAEVPITLIAMFGLVIQSLWVTLFALLLLAIQSSFFGPAKFGILPEIVSDDRLSQANGSLNMFSNLAVITGSLLAGPLSVMYDPKPGNSLALDAPIPWAPGAALILVALIGLASIWMMPGLPAVNPNLKMRWNPFETYWHSVRVMSPTLLTVMLAWSGFYMVGTMALLILPEYEAILSIDYTKTSLLIGGLGVAIAAGSVSAGWLSGHAIRPNFIPLGAVGMSASFIVMGLLPPSYNSVMALICLAGFSAGFYIIPLQALLQYLSPDAERGRFLGTANALSFLLSSAGAALYWLLTNVAGVPANRVHLACALLAVVGTAVGIWQMRRVMADRSAEQARDVSTTS